MPGVFISHSWKDKDIVKNIAAQLLIRSIPVWLDIWEMEIADNLRERISAGIDECSALIVVVSQTSANSKWVDDELEYAYQKERKTGEKIVYPVLVQEVELPLGIAGRIYADFTKSFSEPIQLLVDVFLKKKLEKESVPPSKLLVPIQFSKQIYLKEFELNECIENIVKKYGTGIEIRIEQFLVLYDPLYSKLYSKLLGTIDHIEESAYYSPEIERDLKNTQRYINKCEEMLASGFNEAISFFGLRNRGKYSYGKICAWYARIMKTDMMASLWHRQMQDSEIILPSGGGDFILNPLSNNQDAMRLFEVEQIRRYDIYPSDYSSSFSVWFGIDSAIYKEFAADFVFPGTRLAMVCGHIDFEKYLAPQLLKYFLERGDAVGLREFLSNFRDYLIGPS